MIMRQGKLSLLGELGRISEFLEFFLSNPESELLLPLLHLQLNSIKSEQFNFENFSNEKTVCNANIEKIFIAF